jgi:hypothetical protein
MALSSAQVKLGGTGVYQQKKVATDPIWQYEAHPALIKSLRPIAFGKRVFSGDAWGQRPLKHPRSGAGAALAKLSPEHRVVIVLKGLEDLHNHEIAEILNVSLGTVMSRLFYGRKKLQPYYDLFTTKSTERDNPQRSAPIFVE